MIDKILRWVTEQKTIMYSTNINIQCPFCKCEARAWLEIVSIPNKPDSFAMDIVCKKCNAVVTVRIVGDKAVFHYGKKIDFDKKDVEVV